MPCVCGTGESTETHCLPIIEGKEKASTPEALMRSRYAAYALGKVEHIFESLHPDERKDLDKSATEMWAQRATWKGLEIVATEGGGEKDDTGTVEFIARFEIGGIPQTHHERGKFQRLNGRWYFVDGEIFGGKPVVREGPRVGRNDPCPCGSGKKYKKCHGKAAA